MVGGRVQAQSPDVAASSSPALGSLPVPAAAPAPSRSDFDGDANSNGRPRTDTRSRVDSAAAPVSSTPTYSITVANPAPTAEDVDQESKRISHLAHILKIGAEGNKNIRERVILAQVKTKKNDVYDPDKLRKDVQAIYGMGNLEDVSLDVNDVPGGVLVSFKVVEKPLIKKIDFKGNKKGGLEQTARRYLPQGKRSVGQI